MHNEKPLKRASHGYSESELKELFEQAATGSSFAWVTLGWIYEHGAGIPKNFDEAEKCYKEAASIGDLAAKFYLARLYVENNNYQRAFPLFVSAAANGHLPSIYWTGRLYLRGEGVDRDFQNAERYLRLAAERGHMFARRDYSLGLLRGTFGKREIFKGLFGRISVIFAASKLTVSNPDSELLQ